MRTRWKRQDYAERWELSDSATNEWNPVPRARVNGDGWSCERVRPRLRPSEQSIERAAMTTSFGSLGRLHRSSWEHINDRDWQVSCLCIIPLDCLFVQKKGGFCCCSNRAVGRGTLVPRRARLGTARFGAIMFLCHTLLRSTTRHDASAQSKPQQMNLIHSLNSSEPY